MYPFRKFWEDLLNQKYNYIRSSIEEEILKNNIPTIVWCDMNFEDVYSMLPNIFTQWFTSILNNTPTTPRDRAYSKILISKEFTENSHEIIHWKADHYLCMADIELH